MEYTIREITADEIEASSEIVRKSFQTVADQFGFTPESAPHYAAFSSTPQGLRDLKEHGFTLYGLFVDGKQAGFIAVERLEGTVFRAARLAVLPEYRHGGYGAALINFTFDYARANGGTKMNIGIVDEQTVLKDWYLAMGFKEIQTKTYEGLPFTVCFLEKDLTGADA